jgi:hypothetical protein
MSLKPKHIVLGVIIPAIAVLVGMKLYLEYRPINLYVMRTAPMPASLSNTLHMVEHKIESDVTIASPYETAQEKILPLSEIRKIRRHLSWNAMLPVVIDALTIQNSNRVVAEHSNKRKMSEYQLVKIGDKWRVQSVAHSVLQAHD